MKYKQTIKHIILSTVFGVSAIAIAVFAAYPTTPFTPADQQLDPPCTPGSSNCYVDDIDVTVASGVPSSTPTGSDPILYVDTATGDVYTYSGGSWSIVSAGSDTDFVKVGGGSPVTSDDKYTGGNVGFGGIVTPGSPIHNTGILRQEGKGQSNALEFDTQTIHSLATGGLGHTTVQEKTSGNGTRFYLMPKGTVADANALASGIKLFSTDYEADSTNYHDFGIWSTQNELIFNSKRNGSFTDNLPFVWKYQDSNELMVLQAKDNAALMLGVPESLQQEWTIFEPLHLGKSTVILGRDNAATSEFINNGYYDGSWKRIDTGYAQRLSFDNTGKYTFYTASSAAADSTITWDKEFVIGTNGNIGFPSSASDYSGSNDPEYTIDHIGRTDGIHMPKGTTAERPSTPDTGVMRYNTTDNMMEYWNGTTWVQF